MSKYLIKILSFGLLISCHIATLAQADDSQEYFEANDLKSIFITILTVLGLATVAFLYFSYKNNKKQIKSLKKLNFDTFSSSDYRTIIRQVTDFIPYPACTADQNQKIIYTNQSFENAFPNNQELSSWDDRLLIKGQKLNTNKNGEIKVENEEGTLLNITINPFPIPGTSIQLYSIIIEPLNDDVQIESSNSIPQANLDSLVQSSNSPTIIIDAEGEIVGINNLAIELTEYTETNVLNRSFTKLFQVSDRKIIRKHIKPDNDRQNAQFILKLVTKSNKSVPVELDLINIDLQNTPVYLCVLKDISERIHMQEELIKAKQQAEESDKLKSSFLANMSHEVRTPLNSIMGFTELMSDDQISTQERKEFHQIVKASSNELLNLLNDIMEYSKIESNLIVLNNEEIIPHEIVTSLNVYVQELLANNREILFAIREPIGLKEIPAIKSDTRRIVQILRHLLNNAVKFTYQGHVTLSYQYRPDNSLEFIISDTGIGIPQEKIPNIFNKFRQANDDNSRDFGGAGLGLSICRHLANALGGFLWVSSVEQMGSEFHFILPAINKNIAQNTFDHTIVYYSKEPQVHKTLFRNTRELSLFNFTALLNVPMAHSVSAIVFNAMPDDEQLAKLIAIPQVQSTIILHEESEKTAVIYSPIVKEIGKQFTKKDDLKKFLIKCFNRKIG